MTENGAEFDSLKAMTTLVEQAGPYCSEEPAAMSAAAEAPPRAGEKEAVWAALPGGLTDGGELILLAIKPSLWRPAFEAAPWLLGAAVGAFVATALKLSLFGLSMAGTAQIILLVGFARLAFAIAKWIPTWHVLTNRRILDVRGVRSPVIESCPLIEIRNTYVQSHVLEKRLRIGSITFVTSHVGDPPRVWSTIAKPDEVHAEIRRAIEHAIDHHGV